MSPLRSLILLSLLAVTAFATPSPAPNPKYGPSSCSSREFWYETKACCLPHGGPVRAFRPPQNKQCPPSNWYWHPTKSCCVPHHPIKRGYPTPQCNRGWEWNFGTQCCLPEEPKPTKPNHPHPSPAPYPPPGKYPKKRSPVVNESSCPTGLQACPMTGLSQGYECVDTTEELRYCGGCPSLGKGQDCTAIKGAGNVGCEQGTCKVYTCELGYTRSVDGNSCVATDGSY